MYTLKGTIKVIKDVEQISDSFKKREFVVTETSGQYPQDILLQTVQDRTSLLDGKNVGDVVNVSFNLRGREWTSPDGTVRYFNSLDAWKIEGEVVAPPPAAEPPIEGMGAPMTPPPTTAAPTAPAAGAGEEEDDLPF